MVTKSEANCRIVDELIVLTNNDFQFLSDEKLSKFDAHKLPLSLRKF